MAKKSVALTVDDLKKLVEENKIEGQYSATKIPNDVYHRGPGVSKSGIDLLLKSAAHFKWRPKQEESRVFDIGTAVHAGVLEPDVFEKEVVRLPDDFNGRTKAGRQYLLENANKINLTADDYQAVQDMVESVRNHPVARELLEKGSPEESFYKMNSKHRVLCKCRADWLGDGYVLDLKTTKDASLKEFAKSVANFGYHIQAAFYSDLIHALTGKEVTHFYFAAVEKKPPYACAVYTVAAEDVQFGRELYREGLARYSEAKKSGKWQGYPTQVRVINLPPWSRKR